MVRVKSFPFVGGAYPDDEIAEWLNGCGDLRGVTVGVGCEPQRAGFQSGGAVVVVAEVYDRPLPGDPLDTYRPVASAAEPAATESEGASEPAAPAAG